MHLLVPAATSDAARPAVTLTAAVDPDTAELLSALLVPQDVPTEKVPSSILEMADINY